MVIIPKRENVLPDGSYVVGSILPTESEENDMLTDLRDIDFSPLRNPKPGHIYVLCYRPNSSKKFSWLGLQFSQTEEEEE